MSAPPINFEFTEKQNLAFWTAEESTIILFGGAIRGGKSYWLLLCFIVYCFRWPGSRWIIIRRDGPTLKATILKTFYTMVDAGLAQYIESANQSTLTFRFYNGSEIIFMAESYTDDKELNRFKGLECNGFGVDEINEIQEVTFNKLIERAGSWKVKDKKGNIIEIPPKILATCNPTQNWVKTLFYDRFMNNTLPNSWAYVQSHITDNPHISKVYIESLNLLPSYQYEVFVKGNWKIRLKTGGEFYKCFDINSHIKNLILHVPEFAEAAKTNPKGSGPYIPGLALHVSIDDNVNPYLPLGIFQILDKRIYMIDEIIGVSPYNTTEALVKEFIRRYPAHSSGLFVYGDSTADKEDTKLSKGYKFYRLLLDQLSKYKPNRRVPPANPSVVMRGNFINTILEKQYDGIDFVIDEGCEVAIEDFTNIKEAADGTKLKQLTTETWKIKGITINAAKVSCQRYGHFTDLTDYLICAAFSTSYAEYQRGGKGSTISLGKTLTKKGY